jgi:signal transduction histidine kinase
VRLAPQLETVLFRIAQEAVNNILHHAQARSVTVSLYRQGDRICLRVKDDGQGFDVAQITGQALRLRRFGLMGIQERAELVGGDVTVESAPGQGTCLSVSVPLLGLDAVARPPAG